MRRLQTEDKLVLYVLEIDNQEKNQASFEIRSLISIIRNENFYCIFKDFDKKLNCRTIVRRRSFFIKNNFVSLSPVYFSDFVSKI